MLAGSVLILGSSLVFAGETAQAPSQAKKEAATKADFRPLFIDENGDGICDFGRDHDNDGIPNCQDPDWKKPQDGTGYKNRQGNRNGSGGLGNGFRGGQCLTNASFRNGSGPFGSGICDGTGPKGNVHRKGRN
jgi:hypothetical protein